MDYAHKLRKRTRDGQANVRLVYYKHRTPKPKTEQRTAEGCLCGHRAGSEGIGFDDYKDILHKRAVEPSSLLLMS